MYTTVQPNGNPYSRASTSGGLVGVGVAVVPPAPTAAGGSFHQNQQQLMSSSGAFSGIPMVLSRHTSTIVPNTSSVIGVDRAGEASSYQNNQGTAHHHRNAQQQQAAVVAGVDVGSGRVPLNGFYNAASAASSSSHMYSSIRGLGNTFSINNTQLEKEAPPRFGLGSSSTTSLLIPSSIAARPTIAVPYNQLQPPRLAAAGVEGASSSSSSSLYLTATPLALPPRSASTYAYPQQALQRDNTNGIISGSGDGGVSPRPNPATNHAANAIRELFGGGGGGVGASSLLAPPAMTTAFQKHPHPLLGSHYPPTGPTAAAPQQQHPHGASSSSASLLRPPSTRNVIADPPVQRSSSSVLLGTGKTARHVENAVAKFLFSNHSNAASTATATESADNSYANTDSNHRLLIAADGGVSSVDIGVGEAAMKRVESNVSTTSTIDAMLAANAKLLARINSRAGFAPQTSTNVSTIDVANTSAISTTASVTTTYAANGAVVTAQNNSLPLPLLPRQQGGGRGDSLAMVRTAAPSLDPQCDSLLLENTYNDAHRPVPPNQQRESRNDEHRQCLVDDGSIPLMPNRPHHSAAVAARGHNNNPDADTNSDVQESHAAEGGRVNENSAPLLGSSSAYQQQQTEQERRCTSTSATPNIGTLCVDVDDLLQHASSNGIGLVERLRLSQARESLSAMRGTTRPATVGHVSGEEPPDTTSTGADMNKEGGGAEDGRGVSAETVHVDITTSEYNGSPMAIQTEPLSRDATLAGDDGSGNVSNAGEALSSASPYRGEGSMLSPAARADDVKTDANDGGAAPIDRTVDATGSALDVSRDDAVYYSQYHASIQEEARGGGGEVNRGVARGVVEDDVLLSPPSMSPTRTPAQQSRGGVEKRVESLPRTAGSIQGVVVGGIGAVLESLSHERLVDGIASYLSPSPSTEPGSAAEAASLTPTRNLAVTSLLMTEADATVHGCDDEARARGNNGSDDPPLHATAQLEDCGGGSLPRGTSSQSQPQPLSSAISGSTPRTRPPLHPNSRPSTPGQHVTSHTDLQVAMAMAAVSTMGDHDRDHGNAVGGGAVGCGSPPQEGVVLAAEDDALVPTSHPHDVVRMWGSEGYVDEHGDGSAPYSPDGYIDLEDADHMGDGAHVVEGGAPPVAERIDYGLPLHNDNAVDAASETRSSSAPCILPPLSPPFRVAVEQHARALSVQDVQREGIAFWNAHVLAIHHEKVMSEEDEGEREEEEEEEGEREEEDEEAIVVDALPHAPRSDPPTPPRSRSLPAPFSVVETMDMLDKDHIAHRGDGASSFLPLMSPPGDSTRHPSRATSEEQQHVVVPLHSRHEHASAVVAGEGMIVGATGESMGVGEEDGADSCCEMNVARRGSMPLSSSTALGNNAIAAFNDKHTTLAALTRGGRGGDADEEKNSSIVHAKEADEDEQRQAAAAAAVEAAAAKAASEEFDAFQLRAAAMREALHSQTNALARSELAGIETCDRDALLSLQRSEWHQLVLTAHDEPIDRLFIMDAYFVFFETALGNLPTQPIEVGGENSNNLSPNRNYASSLIAAKLRQFPLPHAIEVLNDLARESYANQIEERACLCDEESALRNDLEDFYAFDTFLADDSLYAVHCKIVRAMLANHVVGAEELTARAALQQELLVGLIRIQISVCEALEMLTRASIVGGDEDDANGSDGTAALISEAYRVCRAVDAPFPLLAAVGAAVSQERRIQKQLCEQKRQREQKLLLASAQPPCTSQFVAPSGVATDSSLHHHEAIFASTSSRSFLFSTSQQRSDADRWNSMQDEMEAIKNDTASAISAALTSNAVPATRHNNPTTPHAMAVADAAAVTKGNHSQEEVNAWRGKYYDDLQRAGGGVNDADDEAGDADGCCDSDGFAVLFDASNTSSSPHPRLRYPFRLPLVVSVRCPPDVLASLDARCKTRIINGTAATLTAGNTAVPNAADIDKLSAVDDARIVESLRRVEALVTSEVSDAVHGTSARRRRRKNGSRGRGSVRVVAAGRFNVTSDDDSFCETNADEGDCTDSAADGEDADDSAPHHPSSVYHAIYSRTQQQQQEAARKGTAPLKLSLSATFSSVNVSFTSPFLTHRRAHQRALERQLLAQHQQRILHTIAHGTGRGVGEGTAAIKPSAATITFLKTTPPASFYYQSCPLAIFSYRQYVIGIVPLLMQMWWGDEDMCVRDVLYEGGGGANSLTQQRQHNCADACDAEGEEDQRRKASASRREGTTRLPAVASRRNSPSPSRPRNPSSVVRDVSAEGVDPTAPPPREGEGDNNHQIHPLRHHTGVPLTVTTSCRGASSHSHQQQQQHFAPSSTSFALQLDHATPADAIREPRRWSPSRQGGGVGVGNGPHSTTTSTSRAGSTVGTRQQQCHEDDSLLSLPAERGEQTRPAKELFIPLRNAGDIHLPSARSDGHALHHQLLQESIGREQQRRAIDANNAFVARQQERQFAAVSGASALVGSGAGACQSTAPPNTHQSPWAPTAMDSPDKASPRLPSQPNTLRFTDDHHQNGGASNLPVRATFAIGGGNATGPSSPPTISAPNRPILANANRNGDSGGGCGGAALLPPASATAVVPQRAAQLAINALFDKCDANATGRVRLSTIITVARQLPSMIDGSMLELESMKRRQEAEIAKQHSIANAAPSRVGGPSTYSFSTLDAASSDGDVYGSVGTISNAIFMLRHQTNYLKELAAKLDSASGPTSSEVAFSSPAASALPSFSSWPSVASLLRKAFQHAREDELKQRGGALKATNDDGMIGIDAFKRMIEGIVKGTIAL